MLLLSTVRVVLMNELVPSLVFRMDLVKVWMLALLLAAARDELPTASEHLTIGNISTLRIRWWNGRPAGLRSTGASRLACPRNGRDAHS